MRSVLTGAWRVLLAAALAASGLPLAAQDKSDWEREQEERNWREGVVALPGAPKLDELIEFEVPGGGSFRFFIDPSALSIGEDGIVRYTIVARSAAGAENVSFEGIRCKSATARIYAFGRSDGQWARGAAPWRRIERTTNQGSQFALWSRYFCPHATPIHDRGEGIRALRAGGHPHVTGGDVFGR